MACAYDCPPGTYSKGQVKGDSGCTINKDCDFLSWGTQPSYFTHYYTLCSDGTHAYCYTEYGGCC